MAGFRARYLDVVGSIYIYNEHRGYTSLDRVMAAARRHCPDDAEFIAAIARHRADERKHDLPCRAWLERRLWPVELWNERLADWCIHKILLLKKLPTLFFLGTRRMRRWPDAGEIG
jgi:hypothetical protein